MIPLFVLFLAISCDVPKVDQVPISYLNIEKMNLISTPNQGSDNNNFKDAWVFVNGKTIGVYELPRKIAIAGDEEGQDISLSIQAGIRDNGVNSAPTVFPFVGNYESILNLQEGEERSIVPEFKYLETTNFRLIADFEFDNLLTFDEDGDTTTSIIITEETASESLRSAKIAVPAGKVFEQASTLVYNDLPKNGSPIYVEIDFKGNRELDIGLIGIEGEQLFKDYFVSLRSENGWKKSYVNLTELVLASGFPGYQVLIGVDNSGGQSAKSVYIDNIKFLHF